MSSNPNFETNEGFLKKLGQLANQKQRYGKFLIFNLKFCHLSVYIWLTNLTFLPSLWLTRLPALKVLVTSGMSARSPGFLRLISTYVAGLQLLVGLMGDIATGKLGMDIGWVLIN